MRNLNSMSRKPTEMLQVQVYDSDYLTNSDLIGKPKWPIKANAKICVCVCVSLWNGARDIPRPWTGL